MQTLNNVGKHSGTSGDGHYDASFYDDGSVVITTRLNDATHTYTVTLTRDQWERLVIYHKWFDLPDELRLLFGDTSMPIETRKTIVNGWSKMDSSERTQLINKLREEQNVLKRVLITVMDCTKILLS